MTVSEEARQFDKTNSYISRWDKLRKKLSRSLRFVRKEIAAAKHADPNENSYAVSYAFTVSFLLLQLINYVECWSLNPCADCSFIIDSREKNEPWQKPTGSR